MKNIFGFVAILVALVMCESIAQAQHPKKAYRIGILSAASEVPQIFGAFQQYLREQGYGEGNILLERRFADGNIDRLPEFASELAALKVDLIVTVTTPAAVAAKRVTTAIPIVMANVADPVGTGLVGSLARPGANITGLSSLAVDLSGKRLELLKEAVPKLNRVAVVWNSEDSGMALISKQIHAAAPPLGLTIQPLAVPAPNDFGSALVTMHRTVQTRCLR